MPKTNDTPNPRNASGFSLDWGDRTYIAGIVNVTPDSFSDGGEFYGAEAAVSHAEELVAAGAHLVDVGGESTRPNAPPVPADEELRRVLPVVRAIAEKVSVPISIDTMKAKVAEKVLEAGARVVNDVSGTRADPEIVAVAAQYNAGLIIVHNEPLEPGTDLVSQVTRTLLELANRAVAQGVRQDEIVLDPGLGFRKGVKPNMELLRRLGELRRSLPFAVMLGHSRKSTLGELFGASIPARDLATAALSGLAAQQQIDIVRVHDVQSTRTVLRGMDRLFRGNRAVHGTAASGEAPDSISLRGIRCYGYHGVSDVEREQGQLFLVDLELELTLERAGRTDDLEDTVNYAQVYNLVRETVAGDPRNLIESVAESVATRLLQAYASSIKQVEVTVHKPYAPVGGALDDVAVTIKRTPGP